MSGQAPVRWTCEDCAPPGEEPWLRGDDVGLQRLQAGEECFCGGNYVAVFDLSAPAWVWDPKQEDWVWDPGKTPA
jgi:hypothetical protein